MLRNLIQKDLSVYIMENPTKAEAAKLSAYDCMADFNAWRGNAEILQKKEKGQMVRFD
jgi:hypothetical protein